jgi:pyruvate/2-oxoglutarate dehydrogenase complex dihydrolipoamide acyltransferase (E2) component
MPLPTKTLQEASILLGIPEAEIRAMVDLRKVRGVLKKGKLTFAPDELAKIKRQRKTLPESVIKSSSAEAAAQAKPPAPTAPSPPPRRPPPSRRIGP